MIKRPYQVAIYNQVFEAWKHYRSIMLQLPTGGGKTVLFVDIIKEFISRGKYVMVIAHRVELIDQARDHIQQSKITVGTIKAGVKPDHSAFCQVASIQTLARRKVMPKAHLIIIDESHHSQENNSYGKLITRYPNALILGVTATPYRLSGHGFPQFKKLIQGPQIREMINDGWLSDFDYYPFEMPDLDRIELSKGDYKISSAREAMKLAPLVPSYCQFAYGKAGVVFACDKEHGHEIAKDYNRIGINAVMITDETPKDLRKDIIDDFKNGDIKIVVNVGILTEGFDFPNMEFVQLARPTKSLSLMLQMIGRVLRVDNDVIKHCIDKNGRLKAISNSNKKKAIILDNAGICYDHDMFDKQIDWEKHFLGTKKVKKTPEEIFEMSYIVEDVTGHQRKVNSINETKGLKLVRMDKFKRELIENFNAVNQLKTQFHQFENLKRKNGSPQWIGYLSLRTFVDHCKKKNILINDKMWSWILEFLHRRFLQDQKTLETEKIKSLDHIRRQFYNNIPKREMISNSLLKKVKKNEKDIREKMISLKFYNKIRSEYLESIK